jgi:hypothetical protein
MTCFTRPLPFRQLAAVAALGIGAAACSTDSPTSPSVRSGPSSISAATTSSDIATSAGNSIAGDIQNLTANEVAALNPSLAINTARFDDKTGSTAGSSTPATTGPSQTCTFSTATQVYTCTTSSQETIVRSFAYFDSAGKPMPKFIQGVTASIHLLVKIDGSVTKDSSFTAVRHSLRDLTVSGFLGDTRIWNGFGSSADTNSHTEALSKRTYTGLAVDTLQAVTFAKERSTHPYPLSGVAIRVVNYTVVSTGKETVTTTVYKRVVVTFNGTANVPITLGNYSCTLHLDTKKVDGCK